MENINPALIENSTRYYIKHALRESKNIKNKYINITVNIFLFLILILSIVGFLIYKYKGKLSEDEKELKLRQKQEYLMTIMQKYSIQKEKDSQNLITNLPFTHPQIMN